MSSLGWRNSGVIVQGGFVAHALAARVFEFEPPFSSFLLRVPGLVATGSVVLNIRHWISNCPKLHR